MNVRNNNTNAYQAIQQLLVKQLWNNLLSHTMQKLSSTLNVAAPQPAEQPSLPEFSSQSILGIQSQPIAAPSGRLQPFALTPAIDDNIDLDDIDQSLEVLENAIGTIAINNSVSVFITPDGTDDNGLLRGKLSVDFDKDGIFTDPEVNYGFVYEDGSYSVERIFNDPIPEGNIFFANPFELPQRTHNEFVLGLMDLSIKPDHELAVALSAKQKEVAEQNDTVPLVREQLTDYLNNLTDSDGNLVFNGNVKPGEGINVLVLTPDDDKANQHALGVEDIINDEQLGIATGANVDRLGLYDSGEEEDPDLSSPQSFFEGYTYDFNKLSDKLEEIMNKQTEYGDVDYDVINMSFGLTKDMAYAQLLQMLEREGPEADQWRIDVYGDADTNATSEEDKARLVVEYTDQWFETDADYIAARDRYIDVTKQVADNGTIIAISAANNQFNYLGERSENGEGFNLLAEADDNVLLVAASNTNGTKLFDGDNYVAHFSSIGTDNGTADPSDDLTPVITAPGDLVFVDSSLDEMSSGNGVTQGTSFASPYIAGLIAVARQVDPSLKTQDIITLFKNTAIDTAASSLAEGFGQINPLAFIKEAAQEASDEVIGTVTINDNTIADVQGDGDIIVNDAKVGRIFRNGNFTYTRVSDNTEITGNIYKEDFSEDNFRLSNLTITETDNNYALDLKEAKQSIALAHELLVAFDTKETDVNNQAIDGSGITINYIGSTSGDTPPEEIFQEIINDPENGIARGADTVVQTRNKKLAELYLEEKGVDPFSILESVTVSLLEQARDIENIQKDMTGPTITVLEEIKSKGVLQQEILDYLNSDDDKVDDWKDTIFDSDFLSESEKADKVLDYINDYFDNNELYKKSSELFEEKIKAKDNHFIVTHSGDDNKPLENYTNGEGFNIGGQYDELFVTAIADTNESSDLADHTIALSSGAGNENKPDFAAPGLTYKVSRDSTHSPDGTISGGMASASYTAGAIALILQKNPNLTVNEVQTILKETATQADGVTEKQGGAGMINIEAALARTPGEVIGRVSINNLLQASITADGQLLIDEDGNGKPDYLTPYGTIDKAGNYKVTRRSDDQEVTGNVFQVTSSLGLDEFYLHNINITHPVNSFGTDLEVAQLEHLSKNDYIAHFKDQIKDEVNKDGEKLLDVEHVKFNVLTFDDGSGDHEKGIAKIFTDADHGLAPNADTEVVQVETPLTETIDRLRGGKPISFLERFTASMMDLTKGIEEMNKDVRQPTVTTISFGASVASLAQKVMSLLDNASGMEDHRKDIYGDDADDLTFAERREKAIDYVKDYLENNSTHQKVQERYSDAIADAADKKHFFTVSASNSNVKRFEYEGDETQNLLGIGKTFMVQESDTNETVSDLSDDDITPTSGFGSNTITAISGLSQTKPGENGTSFAVAHLSGVIGLMLEKNAELNYNEIKTTIEGATVQSTSGAKVLDAVKAIQDTTLGDAPVKPEPPPAPAIDTQLLIRIILLLLLRRQAPPAPPPSPFGGFGGFSQPSPFGNLGGLGQQPSPFGGLGQQPSPFTTFGGNQQQNPFGNGFPNSSGGGQANLGLLSGLLGGLG